MSYAMLKQSWWQVLAVLTLSVTAAMIAMQVLPAFAHKDPSGCDSTGVAISMTVLRADGTTPVATSGDGTVQSAEDVNYRTTVSHAGGSNCNFEGGDVTITTPDGVVHTVATGVPLVDAGSPFTTALAPYTVAESHVVGGFLSASTSYTGGTAHLSVGAHPPVTASTGIATPYTDTALEVSKTVDPAFDREFLWDIEKTVDIDLHDMETGQSGDSEYTVTITQTGSVDSNHSVTGTITIHNPALFASATITDVSDDISGVGAVAVDCGAAFPIVLGPGATLVCTYSSALPNGASRTNTATVDTSGDVDGGSGSADVDFTGVTPTTVINEEVNVEDTFAGSLGLFTGSGAASYTRTFTCDGDAGTHDNTATIIETGQSDAASVTVLCTTVALEVTKTADPAFEREFSWDIDKTVDPAVWDLFTGDTGASMYTVSVTQTGSVDFNHSVSGSITIHNPAAFASATITGVSDDISGVGAAAVDCGVAFPIVLGPGGTLVCTYSSALPNGESRTNTATADTAGDVGGGSGSADIDFAGVAPTTTINGTVNVGDTFAGSLGAFSASGSISYTRTFACDADEGSHNNTATIVETGQSASASVQVNCYDLLVEKTADTSLTRTWDWTIQKSADQSQAAINDGDTLTVNYTVVVSAVATDSDWMVSGTITITNNNPFQAAHLTGVSDIVSPAIAATVVCPALDIPAGGSIACTYTAALPDADDRTNTATASQQNFAYDSAGVGAPSGTTNYSGSAAVEFSGAAVAVIDECVDVSDTNVGALGTVCAADAPTTFNYSITFGTAGTTHDILVECGENENPNVASFVTQDTGATGEANWTVIITVECREMEGCTPGFWRQPHHFGHWPAGYTPDMKFSDMFGRVITVGVGGKATVTDPTLLQAVTATGGGVSALARHAVAALLNSAHPDVNYALDTASVIQMVQDALDGILGLNTVHTTLAEENERGCSLEGQAFLEE
ncbi:MAG: hypothetical protein HY532_00405 [Chloroflexi bacterium]|nr:hypothetical protein [Chloroflexota bacterium]